MYLSTGINTSPTITRKAGAALTNAAFRAARFDAGGNLILAGAGENAIGVFIATTPQTIAVGEDVTVQIKDIGLWMTGAAVAAGAELAANATGAAVTAVAGNHVIALALENATGAGSIIQVHIVQPGRRPA